MRLHLIDTDVFIRANREHYGLDYCPAFWDWLGFHGQAGNVGSVVAVLEEIRYPVELKQWASGPGRRLFRRVDADVMAAAKEVSRWVHGEGYLPGAVTSFMFQGRLLDRRTRLGSRMRRGDARGGSADRQEGQDSECLSRPWRPVHGSLDDAEDDRGAVHSGSKGKNGAERSVTEAAAMTSYLWYQRAAASGGAGRMMPPESSSGQPGGPGHPATGKDSFVVRSERYRMSAPDESYKNRRYTARSAT